MSLKISKNKGNGGIIKLKIVARKLQRSLNSLGKKENNAKEGHFAVLAMEGDEEPKRFVVPLSYLTHPTFLRLLEEAAEEYGFDGREGALAIPCRPVELERILAERWDERRSRGHVNGGRDGSLGSYPSCNAMVQSF